jgi:hypothetical protein
VPAVELLAFGGGSIRLKRQRRRSAPFWTRAWHAWAVGVCSCITAVTLGRRKVRLRPEGGHGNMREVSRSVGCVTYLVSSDWTLCTWEGFT